jgi:hypothetical protein
MKNANNRGTRHYWQGGGACCRRRRVTDTPWCRVKKHPGQRGVFALSRVGGGKRYLDLVLISEAL